MKKNVFTLIECDSWSYIPVDPKPMTAYLCTTNGPVSMGTAVGMVVMGDTVLGYVTYRDYFF